MRFLVILFDDKGTHYRKPNTHIKSKDRENGTKQGQPEKEKNVSL